METLINKDVLPEKFISEIAVVHDNHCVIRSNIRNMDDINECVRLFGEKTNTKWNSRIIIFNNIYFFILVFTLFFYIGIIITYYINLIKYISVTNAFLFSAFLGNTFYIHYVNLCGSLPVNRTAIGVRAY